MNQPPTTRPTFGVPPRGPSVAAQRPAIDFRAGIRKGATAKAPRIVMIGVEGVGKSTAGAQMESPIFLCAEDGLVGTQFAETASWSAPDWESALGFLDWLRTEAHEYKSLVVDTGDGLEPKLFEFVCGRDNMANIGAYGYGKGYTVAAEEFRRFLGKLDALNKAGMAILVLAHSQIKAFANPVGDNYDRYEPKVTKQIAGMVKEWADAVLFARFKVFAHKGKGAMKAKGIGGQERVVHTTHNAGWDAKNRYGLPDEMPLDMGTILEAIRTANGAGGESAEDIAAEIRNLAAILPENIQAKIENAIDQASPDAAALAIVLNKTRTTVTKHQSEQESTNG